MKFKEKPIPGFEDKYYLDPKNMQVINKQTGRALKPQKDGAGYAEVQLWKNNRGTHKTLHRLFAEAYIPNPNNLPNINHKDENTMNYSLDNLEWCTQSYNQKYGAVNKKRGPRISAALKGRPKPWVVEQKGKPVVGIDSYGNEIRFPSAKAADRQLGLSSCSVARAANGHRLTAGGYTWRFE